MSYLVLARKWRPQTFEEVVGQSHVTRTLQNAISTSRVGHGYLFTGPRGVGKTSTARILAKALNCAKGPTPIPCGECDSCREVAGTGSLDVMEIDGASNNSVEDIRDLREKIVYTGTRDRHKIYIIDEVHMLSSAAFNALLKTLEEPPSHVVFIFATTEVQKVPATILSRTQRFDFRRIGAKDLITQLKKILDAESIASSPEALSLVARTADGSMRDAQTLLDQVISYAGIKAVTAEDVLQVLGGVQESQALRALSSGLQGDAEPAFEWVRQLYERGADFRLALETLQSLLRGLLLIKSSSPHLDSVIELLPETVESLKNLVPALGMSRLLGLLKAASEAENQLRYSSNPRLVVELFLVRLSATQPQGSLGELFDELSALEQRLNSASFSKVILDTTLPVENPPLEAGAPTSAIEEIVEVLPPQELTLEVLKSHWESVVGRVSSVSLMLGTSARDAELASYSKGQLVLRTRNQKQKEILESLENRRALEAALKDALGAVTEVKVLHVAPQIAPVKVSDDGSRSGTKPSQEEVEKLLKESPGIRRVQELFGAEITEVKKV